MNDQLEKVSYQFFENNRYTVTEFVHDNHEYTGICNNGFTKFFSNKCRAYWLSQNELSHLTPDWKYHVSVNHTDVPRAWDIIVKILLENNFRTGAKVLYLKENSLVKKGREITVYIYKYVEDYLNSPIAVEHCLAYSDEHSEDYWLHIFKKIEEEMEINRVRSNGLADGDLKLGNYVSIRNEAFVYCHRSALDVYPPDSCGWNAAKHDLPFDIRKISKELGRTRLIIIYI